MASMDSVNQKFYRTTVHFEELHRELRTYYESKPSAFEPQDLSGEDGLRLVFREAKPVPARIGLIAGDCIQAMRSSLDYLVWELVLAHGKIQPGTRNAFPIALTSEVYRKELKRGRLEGVHPEAIASIDALQPFLLSDQSRRDGAQLAILEELANINKHRRVLLTGLGGFCGESDPLPLSYMETHLDVTSAVGDHYRGRFISFVSLKERKPTQGREIAGFIDTLASYVQNQVFPLFKKFLE